MSLYYNEEFEPTVRTKINRHPERGRYDVATVESILDEGIVGHVGVVADGQPYVIPMLYARDGDTLYLHGSSLSRLVGAMTDGVPVCFTVSIVDGLVLARSAFRHSVNFRSVVVLGQARAPRDKEEKLAALRAIVEHVAPGRSDQVRGPNAVELKVTEVAVLDIREASAKVRTGPPSDKPKDYSTPVWAGELPLGLAVGVPIPDSRCTADVPSYIRNYSRGHEQPDAA
jgi:uncharacterized protein